jgi:hypothetical protein
MQFLKSGAHPLLSHIETTALCYHYSPFEQTPSVVSYKRIQDISFPLSYNLHATLSFNPKELRICPYRKEVCLHISKTGARKDHIHSKHSSAWVWFTENR